MFWYVYILRCNDNKLYTGCTSRLKDRIIEHQNGEVKSTKNRRPFKLLSCFAFNNKYTAYNFEKYLKSGSGKAFLYKRLI